MARNPIERALGVWSTSNYRSVMLPGLGAVTCGELCDAIAAERALAERAGGVRFVGNIPGSSSASGFAPLTTEPAAPEGRQEAVACIACEDKPAVPNDPCAVCGKSARPSEQAVSEAAMSEAEAIFADYFRRNYPGPDTIIGKPDWHSPKIFRAALHALRSVDALKAAMEAGG